MERVISTNCHFVHDLLPMARKILRWTIRLNSHQSACVMIMMFWSLVLFSTMQSPPFLVVVVCCDDDNVYTATVVLIANIHTFRTKQTRIWFFYNDAHKNSIWNYKKYKIILVRYNHRVSRSYIKSFMDAIITIIITLLLNSVAVPLNGHSHVAIQNIYQLFIWFQFLFSFILRPHEKKILKFQNTIICLCFDETSHLIQWTSWSQSSNCELNVKHSYNVRPYSYSFEQKIGDKLNDFLCEQNLYGILNGWNILSHKVSGHIEMP